MYSMYNMPWWTKAATGVSLIPIGFFLYFATHLGAGGVWHYLQAASVAGLIILGWYKPQVAGWALVALALLFTVIYFVEIYGEIQIVPSLVVVFLFFLPILAAGGLLLYGHLQDARG